MERRASFTLLGSRCSVRVQFGSGFGVQGSRFGFGVRAALNGNPRNTNRTPNRT